MKQYQINNITDNCMVIEITSHKFHYEHIYNVIELPTSWLTHFAKIKDETIIEYFKKLPVKVITFMYLPSTIVNKLCCRFSAKYAASLFDELCRIIECKITSNYNINNLIK